EETESLISELAKAYSDEGKGLRILSLGDKVQMCSAPEYREYINRVLEARRAPSLSKSALEVLAIVAYYQPVTRAAVDAIRGVDSSYTVGSLAEKGLIKVTGKLEAPGRPSLYSTTENFLRVMDISSLDELPALPDLTSSDGIMQLQESINTLMERENTEQLSIEGN
ncbi:MAG: SMC-Scp complex subunit ScpB, partial [Oscillospiraceae bacterium]|nr:SMC-Scp complex subunit ScpB [Oscillospiraceae bacterium]